MKEKNETSVNETSVNEILNDSEILELRKKYFGMKEDRNAEDRRKEKGKSKNVKLNDDEISKLRNILRLLKIDLDKIYNTTNKLNKIRRKRDKKIHTHAQQYAENKEKEFFNKILTMSKNLMFFSSSQEERIINHINHYKDLANKSEDITSEDKKYYNLKYVGHDIEDEIDEINEQLKPYIKEDLKKEHETLKGKCLRSIYNNKEKINFEKATLDVKEEVNNYFEKQSILRGLTF